MSDPLLYLGVGFIVSAVMALFFNGVTAFVLFIIGIGIIKFYNTTPRGKAEFAQAQANQVTAMQLEQSLWDRFDQFSKNPTDVESLEFILKTLASSDKNYLKKMMRPIIVPLLSIKPLDKSIRDLVFDYAKKTITISVTRPDETSSKEVYDAALEILSEHPEQLPLRQYALEIGRWHYTIQRPNRKITIYDEQAIQNDIAVRSK